MGLAVGTGGGGFTDMDVLSTVQTVNLLGENCKETAFRLDAVSAGAYNQMTARLSMIADENGCAITDYGIVFY